MERISTLRFEFGPITGSIRQKIIYIYQIQRHSNWNSMFNSEGWKIVFLVRFLVKIFLKNTKKCVWGQMFVCSFEQ